MTSRSNPIARLAALAVAAVAIAGCSENRSGDLRKVLPINAVAYNDSVARGDTLFLKVQYTYGTTCERTARFEIQAVAGTSEYNVVPVAVYRADQACTGISGSDIATLRVTDVGSGPRTFHVLGSNQVINANVIGSSDPNFVKETGIAFRIRVEDVSTGLPIPSALVTIRDLDTNAPIADGSADANGRFDYTLPCGPNLSYVISAAASGRATNLIVRTPPARCGLPEFVVIRV